jgi:hypothetical protein
MDGEDGSQDTSAEIDPEIQKITDQLNSRAWNQGTQQQPPFSSEISGEPVQAGMTPEEFAAAPALDPHNDDEAWQALIPESPELPWWQDSSHENHTSNLGKLMRVMAAAGIGALAGRGGQEALIAQSHGMRSGGIGTGFSYGAQAVQNLQNLALQRQEMADKSAYQQAQTGMLQARTQAFPGSQDSLSTQRTARAGLMDAQTQKIAADLKRVPADKFLHAYNGADGKVHFKYQRSNGTSYEELSDQPFYQKPEVAAKPMKIVGHDGVYMYDPQTHEATKVVPFAPAQHRQPSQAKLQQLELWKVREWHKIGNNAMLTDEQKNNAWQDLQNTYEKSIATLGGTPSHYDVRSGSPTPTAPGSYGGDAQPTPNAHSNGSNEIHYKIQNGQLVPE